MFLDYGEETEIMRHSGMLSAPATTPTPQTVVDDMDNTPDTAAIEQMFRVKRGINVR